MTYLPSRKFVLYTSSILIAGGLIAFAKYSTQEFEALPPTGGVVAMLPAEKPNDRDGDGLLDWEELVARTDPSNPDSNGDGVKDGEEQKTLKTFYEEAGIEAGSSITPTKNIFSLLPGLLEKSPDGQMNDEVKKEISDAVQKEVERLQKRRNPFSKSDVAVDKTKTLRAYINEIAVITEKHFPESAGDAGYESELTILAELSKRISEDGATREDIFSSLDKIEAFRHRYFSVANDLKRVAAPTAATSAHLELLNFFANVGTALEEISAIDRDVIVGVIGIQQYSKELAGSREPLYAIKKLIDSEKLTFTASEPGKTFVDQYLKQLST